MKESRHGCLKLLLYSNQCIELLLDYCYFNVLPAIKKVNKNDDDDEDTIKFVDLVLELHSLSHYLMYNELHNNISVLLLSLLKPQTILQIFKQSIELHHEYLIFECKRYIVRNYHSIIQLSHDKNDNDGKELLVYVLNGNS